MEIIEIYQGITDKKLKQSIRNEIVKVCEIQQTTFYSWINRKIIPKWHIARIVDVLSKNNLLQPQIS
jgi:hypothetical protein